MKANKDRRLSTRLKVVKERCFAKVNIRRDRLQAAARKAEELRCEAAVAAIVGDRPGPNHRFSAGEGVPVRVGDPEHNGGIGVGNSALGWPEEVGERGECGEKGLNGTWGEHPNQAHQGEHEEIDDPLPEAAWREAGGRSGRLATDR